MVGNVRTLPMLGALFCARQLACSIVEDVLAQVAAHLSDQRVAHPLRVGVDGVCGAGKSTFARALVARLRSAGVPAFHVDSDGFHHVRARRRRRTDDPARGYYENAYDFDALASRVLRPLGPGGDRRYATRVHDLASDEVITSEVAVAPPDAVVVFDATFVQVAALDGLWDEVIFLDVDEPAAVARGVARDAAAMGGAEAARAAYDTRYMAACRLYLAERDPRSRATIVIDHTDPARSRVVRWGAAAS